jgi:hypothetical protein
VFIGGRKSIVKGKDSHGKVKKPVQKTVKYPSGYSFYVKMCGLPDGIIYDILVAVDAKALTTQEGGALISHARESRYFVSFTYQL